MTRARMAELGELTGVALVTAGVHVLYGWWSLIAAGLSLVVLSAYLDLRS